METHDSGWFHRGPFRHKSECMRFSLNLRTNSALEFGEFSKLNSNSFWFVKKNMFSGFRFFWICVRGNLQTQPLSLENSPNSTSECVYFLNFDFFFEKMSLEILNLSLDKISKLKKNVRRFFLIQKTPSARIFCYQKKFCTHIFIWVWKFYPNSGSKSPNSFFSKKKSKFKTYTHSEVEFGEFSKLKGWVTQIQKKENPENMFFFQKPKWVWRILQTQVLSLENSPNSDSIFFSDFGEISKLKGWVWRIFQIRVQNLQTHSFLKKSKLRGWIWRILQNLWLRILQTQFLFQKHPQP